MLFPSPIEYIFEWTPIIIMDKGKRLEEAVASEPGGGSSFGNLDPHVSDVPSAENATRRGRPNTSTVPINIPPV